MTDEAVVNEVKEFLKSTQNIQNALVANDFDMQKIRANSLLKRDEWKTMDAIVTRVARENLVGINDLRNKNLTTDMGDIGTIYASYSTLTDMSPAETNMDGRTSSEKDISEFAATDIPLPITSKDFSINIRKLKASRNGGRALDTQQTQTATELVSIALEDMLFKGGLTLKGNTIYGYTNHPDINSSSITGSWDTTTNIYEDVNSMMSDLESAGYLGPYTLYIAREQASEVRAVDAEGSGDLGTARRRLLDLEEIDAVKVSRSLADGEAVLVELSSKVVTLGVAQDITPVSWESGDGMLAHFKILAGIVPMIRSDADSNSGIAYVSSV